MPNPFPGIDPYLEAQGRWPDFHARFIAYACDMLADRLPGHYVAQIEERLSLVELPAEPGATFRPDLAILRDDSAAGAPGTPGIATIEPVVIPMAMGVVEEVRETWIEVLHLEDRSLVTAIELLSPGNKVEPQRSSYLAKRVELLRQPVHLVELDFLLAGQRLPMRRPLPTGHYFAFVARADRRPDCEVYTWTVRQPLPTVPVPLLAPDPDVALDLAALFATAYDRGRYRRLLRHDAPPPAALGADDRAWAEAVARGRQPG
jgi:hypothetical protein